MRLREEFGLYANLRSVKTMVPGGRYEDIDLVLIRENIEGLYVAFDVIVTTNLFGDILSDLMSGLVGGLGMTPGRQCWREGSNFRGGARLGSGHRR